MSNTRYIEINSAYRNRNEWEEPAEFEIQLSQSSRASKARALDPISNSSTKTNWVSNAFRNDTNSATIVLTVLTTGVGDTGDYTRVVVTATATQLQHLEDYYVGAIGQDTAPSTTISNRVLSYKYLGNAGAVDRGEFLFDGLFPIGTTAITLYDPSDVTVQSQVQLFVPDGRIGENAYVNCLVYNETRGQSAPITKYDGITHIVTADASAVSGYAWAITDSYSIRESVPSFTGVTTVHTNSLFTLSTNATTEDGFYVGDFLRVIDTTAPATIPVVAPTGETRRIIKYLGLNTSFVSPAPGVTSSFKLLSGSSVDNYYVGGYLVTGLGSYLVTSYTGSTRSGTISGAFGGEVIGVNVQMRSATISPAFTATPTASMIELLPFTRDQYNSLHYSGSMVSQQQDVCSEIELLSLILPNTTLAVGQGSRIAFYPYVYVELSSVTSSSGGTNNIIYSNNPNATKMLFRAPIDDVINPESSAFIKIDSDGQVQTVKFKPNDTLKFSVHLPNGELYKTVESEFFSPSEPNALIQISACFSIKRIIE